MRVGLAAEVFIPIGNTNCKTGVKDTLLVFELNLSLVGFTSNFNVKSIGLVFCSARKHGLNFAP